MSCKNRNVATFFIFVLRLVGAVCFLRASTTEFFLLFRDSVSDWLNYRKSSNLVTESVLLAQKVNINNYELRITRDVVYTEIHNIFIEKFFIQRYEYHPR